MSDYRLQYLDHEVELPLGEFTIGRGSKCQLIIDDPQVSRRHAILRIATDLVVIEDLGSRNATVVNGVVARGKVTLIGGDKVQIGRHQIVLVRCKLDDSRDEISTDGGNRAARFQSSPLQAAVGAKAPRNGEAGEAAEESTAPSSLLAELAQKALSAGNVEEAEWILGKLLAEFHYRASGGDPPSHAQLEAVIGHALRLARLTGKTIFLDGLFDVLGAAGYVLDSQAVGELEALGRQIPALAKGRLGKYVAALHGRAGTDGRLLARLEAICLPG